MEQYFIIFKTIWEAAKDWWWVVLPILLWHPFLFLWLWWREERWSALQRTILLEIKAPRDVLKPLKAMEQVFSGLWGILYGPPDWWEKWIDGEMSLSYAFEIVSIGGEIHFFIRIREDRRNAVESTIYSQYPDAEISIAEDYTKYIPKDIPNKDWDLYGAAYQELKEDVYPLKTYAKFFEEKEVGKEEKRIDPLSNLLEGMAKLGPGEQLWVQIIALPVTNAENNYVDRGKALVNKLIRRPEKRRQKSIVEEGMEGLVFC